MKRLVTGILALMLVFFIAACTGNPRKTPISNNDTTSGQSPKTDQSPSTSSHSSPQKEEVSIESTVLLEQDGLVITAKELVEDSIWGIGLKVLIENNSTKNLGVRCNSLIVNNYMISELFSCSVAAGKKSNDTIHLLTSELEAAGITTISDIIVSFEVYDSDSYHTIFETDEIEIKTSAYGSVEQPVMDDGKELFNKDGIRIVGRYVEEDSFWGAGILLFIENNYGENIIVQCDNMSINGFMVSPIFSCSVIMVVWH